MNEIYAKVRAVAIRGLEEAEAAGDFKAAMDASKLLISLEQSIKDDEPEAAVSKPIPDLGTVILEAMSPDEFRAHLVGLAAGLQDMIATLTPKEFEEPPPEDRYEIPAADDEPSALSISPPSDTPAPIEPPPPAPEPMCRCYCSQTVIRCTGNPHNEYRELARTASQRPARNPAPHPRRKRSTRSPPTRMAAAVHDSDRAARDGSRTPAA